MFNIDKFVSDFVTFRKESLFEYDIHANRIALKNGIGGKRVCVIGGAGSIGSQFIRAILEFEPSELVVVDLNENALTELTRDLRATYGQYVPERYLTYAISFTDSVFEEIFRENKGFDIVANFAAHKHVRSEKDKFSVRALIENNDLKAKNLMELLSVYPPEYFFCVSTDKAVNPVNIMGASKRIMEDLVMGYSDRFNVTTARFANVAFSNGSLPLSFVERINNRQPLAAPTDVKRYFVSPVESGHICMLACILGKSGEVFFPKLDQTQMTTFTYICDRFIDSMGYVKKEFESEEQAKKFAASMPYDSKFWPVFYSKSDTTGEKSYEEFYEESEEVVLDRFRSLGVVTRSNRHTLTETLSFFDKMTAAFSRPGYTKAEIVDLLCEFIPEFNHKEKDKSLDQKM